MARKKKETKQERPDIKQVDFVEDAPQEKKLSARKSFKDILRERKEERMQKHLQRMANNSSDGE